MTVSSAHLQRNTNPYTYTNLRDHRSYRYTHSPLLCSLVHLFTFTPISFFLWRGNSFASWSTTTKLSITFFTYFTCLHWLDTNRHFFAIAATSNNTTENGLNKLSSSIRDEELLRYRITTTSQHRWRPHTISRTASSTITNMDQPLDHSSHASIGTSSSRS